MTMKNSTTNKNLTIVFSSEKHTQVERLAKQEKRSKSQMANILIEEAMLARNNPQAKVLHLQNVNHG
ncbi:MAG: hypothetical protein HRU05_09670 [Oceanospirillaceae bacterium]|nr:hypothetical protein [Oceanospirillaceae bacterium]